MFASLSHREVLFLLAGLFFLALLVLAGLAFLAVRLLGRKDSGAGAAGVTGCALAGVLGCLGLCALVAFGVLAVVVIAGRAVDRAIDHLPSDVWRYDHQEHVPAPRSGRAEVIFRARGEQVEFEPVLDLVREVAGQTFATRLSTSSAADGSTVSELRVEIDAEGAQLKRIDDELEARAGELRLPDGSEIEYLGVRREV